MKILAVGRNYVEHIKELNNEMPEEPVIFTKPDTALLIRNRPFYYPDFSQDIHHEVELVIKIKKAGRHIPEKFAANYFDEIAVGIDFTARDLQQAAKEKRLPWALAKGFDGSAPLSPFQKLSNVAKNGDPIHFRLEKNGDIVQEGSTDLMIYSFAYIISYVSKFITLKAGDLIFTGTPKGVGPVVVGDRLEAFIEEKKLLKVEIK